MWSAANFSSIINKWIHFFQGLQQLSGHDWPGLRWCLGFHVHLNQCAKWKMTVLILIKILEKQLTSASIPLFELMIFKPAVIQLRETSLSCDTCSSFLALFCVCWTFTSHCEEKTLFNSSSVVQQTLSHFQHFQVQQRVYFIKSSCMGFNLRIYEESVYFFTCSGQIV